jgi:hypothetical protein
LLVKEILATIGVNVEIGKNSKGKNGPTIKLEIGLLTGGKQNREAYHLKVDKIRIDWKFPRQELE